MVEEPEKWLDNMLIVVIVSFIMGFIAFEVVVQTTLVDINPMFSDRYAAKMGNSGRAPDTPAGIALWTTCMVFVFIYLFVIKPYLISWVTEVN